MNTSLNVAYAPAISAAAARHHLDPRLLAAVAAQETGGPGTDSGRNIVGDQGHGHGLFQIDDRWHAFARTPAAMDPARNADYAAGMLEGGLQRYGGDVHKALSAYNAGSPTATGTTTDWGDGKPVGYADSVLRHLARLDGSAGAAAPGSDPRDAAAGVDALRTAAAQLSSAGTPAQLGSAGSFAAFGSGTSAGLGTAGTSSSQTSTDAEPPMMMPLNLPAYKPLAQIDSTERDVAPSVAGLGDGGDDD